MYYTVYQITNQINGKIYIGCHKTNDLNDDYMGSGLAIKRACEKHGIENFRKEYLCMFDNPEDMFEKETILVNESFVARSDTYNIRLGGRGGWDHVDYRAGRKAANKVLLEKYGEYFLQEIGKLAHNNRTEESYKASGQKALATIIKRYGHGAFYNKKHTKETKARIGAANAAHQKGKKNSQYGTCWIHNNRVSKKIEKDNLNEYLIEGWIKGRKIKF